MKLRSASARSVYRACRLDVKNDLDLKGVSFTMARPRPPYSGRTAMRQVEVSNHKPIVNDLPAGGRCRYVAYTWL